MALGLPGLLGRRAAATCPSSATHDGFDFDTQIIVQLLEAGKRIVEIPIPTYYGDEICHVNGSATPGTSPATSLRYRAHKMGFGTGELAFASEAYELKEADGHAPTSIVAPLARAAGRRAASSTSAAPTACSPSACATRATTSPASTSSPTRA